MSPYSILPSHLILILCSICLIKFLKIGKFFTISAFIQPSFFLSPFLFLPVYIILSLSVFSHLTRCIIKLDMLTFNIYWESIKNFANIQSLIGTCDIYDHRTSIFFILKIYSFKYFIIISNLMIFIILVWYWAVYQQKFC